MEVQALQAQLQRAQNEIAQKDAKVVKLKGLLTRSMRSDKRREQQIESLQIDLADKVRHIEALNQELEGKTQFAARQADRISQLESDLAELTNRLQSGVGSEAAQKRNERMKQMLEKSNVLYAELQTKYQKVCQDLDTEKQKRSHRGKPIKFVVLSDEETAALNDDGTYEFIPTSRFRQPGVDVVDMRQARAHSEKEKQAEQPLLKVYLRQVLTEFFIADTTTQVTLIPVVMQLLECTPEQIQAAQRGFADGKQIFTKATSALRL